MRTRSWIILFCSFILGLVGAFVVAAYTFDAKPAAIPTVGPTVKILVTKQAIPLGAEVTAEAIAFEDIPVAELPEKALTDFNQVYRRRSVFAIPAGYPLCEDFLLAQETSLLDENRYLPAGSQIVSLEVEQLRRGDTVSKLEKPISEWLSPAQKISIKAVPRTGSKGFLAQKRDLLLKQHGPEGHLSEDGEFVLENVAIHRIEGSAQAAGKDEVPRIQTVSLILTDEEAEKLMQAARGGRLRVVAGSMADPENHAMADATASMAASVTASKVTAKQAVENTATPAVAAGEDTKIAKTSPPPVAETTPKHGASIEPAVETAVARMELIPTQPALAGDLVANQTTLATPNNADSATPGRGVIPVTNSRSETVISFFSPTIIYANQTDASNSNELQANPAGMSAWGRAETTVDEAAEQMTRQAQLRFTEPRSSRPPVSPEPLKSAEQVISEEPTVAVTVATTMPARYSPFATRSRQNAAQDVTQNTEQNTDGDAAREAMPQQPRPFQRNPRTGATVLR